MKKDAEVHAEEDKKKKEEIDVRNNADALVFNLEKQMRDHDAKIEDDLKKKVNTKIGDLKELLKKEEASSDDIKKATEELSTEAQEIGKIVYEAAAKENQQPAEESSGSEKKEDVVDAEVVDEKKEDK